MHDVSADQAEFSLNSLGAEDLATEDGGAEAGGIALDRVDDGIGGLVFLGIPVVAVGQYGRELLAEQAGDMLAFGGQTVVNG